MCPEYSVQCSGVLTETEFDYEEDHDVIADQAKRSGLFA